MSQNAGTGYHMNDQKEMERKTVLKLLKEQVNKEEPVNDTEKGLWDIGSVRREKWLWNLWEKQVLSTKK